MDISLLPASFIAAAIGSAAAEPTPPPTTTTVPILWTSVGAPSGPATCGIALPSGIAANLRSRRPHGLKDDIYRPRLRVARRYRKRHALPALAGDDYHELPRLALFDAICGALMLIRKTLSAISVLLTISYMSGPRS